MGSRFLVALPDVLEASQLRALDREFGFTGTANGEIARRWYSIVAASSYTPAYDELARFLTRVGRMKLVLPVYRALVHAPAGGEFAAEVFEAARPGYHPITTAAVQQVVAPIAGRCRRSQVVTRYWCNNLLSGIREVRRRVGRRPGATDHPVSSSGASTAPGTAARPVRRIRLLARECK